MNTQFVVPSEWAGQRIDKFLAEHLDNHPSRTRIQQAIVSGSLQINNQTVVDPNYRIKIDDQCAFCLPDLPPTTLIPTQGDLDILFEDEFVIVLNKPEGQVVHLGNQVKPGTTLVENVLSHTPLSTAAGIQRPGVVHRLDQATSGVIIFAKTDQAYWLLTKAFAERRIHKTYYALVEGVFACQSGIIQASIGRNQRDRTAMCVIPTGRSACTQWERLEAFSKAHQTLLACYPITGRTHQIRVHLKHIGHPIVGDEKYGKSDVRLFLHAYQIAFVHPITQKELIITAPLPTAFNERIERLRYSERSVEA
ncbi:MAG: RluA family pseudouridine synthase [Opitutales bacterium]|nr:RluA family pseudouridine synthase [Opitutales bacterium]